MGQASGQFHTPVLAEEVIEVFRALPAGVVVDATYGGGGHTRALTEALSVRVLGIDRDPAAHQAAPDAKGVELVTGNYRDLGEILEAAGLVEVSGVLFDLGVSSHQLDTADRGFSYRQSGPLDMRMGPDAGFPAATIVNEWPAEDIAQVLRKYGEERYARRIAAALVAARPIEDTGTLAGIIRDAIPAPARRTGGHPARRSFQALRIAVNDELNGLSTGLEAALDHLAPGGRCAVISYHSLEDRLVKRRFAEGAVGCTCPPDLPACVCDDTAELRLITRKPITPSSAEIESNPRARSAKLRVAERTAA